MHERFSLSGFDEILTERTYTSKGRVNSIQANANPNPRTGIALGKRNEIRNFIGCREINNLGAA